MHVVSIIGRRNQRGDVINVVVLTLFWTGAIKRMLNLNNPLPKSQSAAEPVWKVLCFNTLELLCVYYINAPVKIQCL